MRVPQMSGEGDELGVGVGVVDGVLEGDGVGVGELEGVGVGVGEIEGVGVGVRDGDGDGVPEGVFDGDGELDGVALGDARAAWQPSSVIIAVRPSLSVQPGEILSSPSVIGHAESGTCTSLVTLRSTVEGRFTTSQ
jgi:hypothetical protein